MSRQFLKIRNGTSYPGLASDPSDPADGDLYFNTTSQVFRQYTNGAWSNVGAGTVTSVSVATANGLAGTSSGGTTPALTLSTTITGILQGDGTAISAASTTGSGNVVLATSPTLVTPALGTPSSVVLTNATGTASSLTAGLSTSLAAGSTNAIPYQTASGVTAFLSQGSGVLQESAGAPSWTLAPTFTTQASYDQSTRAATDAYVWNVSSLFMAYVPLSGLTSGTYSFASNGSAAVVNVTASGGSVTAVSFVSGGSGFAVGDIIVCTSNGGNHDAYVVITAVSGTAATAASVLYGGTGYTSGTGGSASAATTAPFTFSLTGTLTGNVTLLMTPGTYLTQGNQWIFFNNTTGSYTTTVRMSNGSDTAIGTGVILPQGSNNSIPIYVTTDGETDVWYGDTPLASRLSGQVSLSTQVSGTLPISNGGTGQTSAAAAYNALSPMTTTGDIEYESATGTASRLGIGSTGQVLTVVSGKPAWSSAGTGTVTSVTFTGDGTVLSSTPSSAVTSSGTLTASLNTQSKNTFLAGPTTGSNATPTFRALATADFVAPTIQKFTTGSSTYTLPSSPRAPLYIRVRMVGGGGGGVGGGTAAGSAGGTGGTTTFGTSLLSASGGAAGAWNGAAPSGGTASLGSGPIGIAIAGSGPGSSLSSSGNSGASSGGSSAFGGSGLGGFVNVAGGAAASNSGSGGGGGGSPSGGQTGSGGASGGFVDAIITSPSSTYSYAVGSGGSAGGAGTGGAAGGAGGSGLIEVTEYYQ